MDKVVDIFKKKMVPESNMEILSSYWFSNSTGITGIVLCYDVVTHQTKAYIGTGKGISEESDEIEIAKWGTKISKNVAELYFGVQENRAY